MIPKIARDGIELIEERIPSRTYRLSDEPKSGSGYVDGIEAVIQAIYKILNTERYKYTIYSWNYGIELLDLFGEPMSYVISEIETRIREALLVDERITDIRDFECGIEGKRILSVRFKVHTIYGQAEVEKVVKI
ncbi:MAG: DUF2634 domain-containing protein [Bacillota bacterium]|nr:DUF2634 domain-containing protein [Bacillota bacterium]